MTFLVPYTRSDHVTCCKLYAVCSHEILRDCSGRTLHRT